MNYIFKGEVIDYTFSKTSNETIIFLHGWGGNKSSFTSTINLVKNKFNVLTLTIPTTQNTNTTWDMFDYRDLIINLCSILNINNPIIICHSFGFRIATLLKEKINIKKIIVTGGAGMKKNNIFKKTTLNHKILNNKLSKMKTFLNFSKQNDYSILSNINKQTFKNVVNLNTINLINFNCPLLLFWGLKDYETPIWIAKKLKKKNNAKLIMTKSNHFAYLNENSYFNNSVLGFINEHNN